MKNAIDILKMAILMERRGRAFYNKVASQTDDPNVKRIFELMAKEEVIHERFLLDQMTHFQNNENFEIKDYPKEGEDTIAHMILSEKISAAINSAGFEAAAISAAIDMESKAIEVYSNRAEETGDANEKKLYQWLAEWEQSHHKILIQLDNELKEKIWYDNQFWPF